MYNDSLYMNLKKLILGLFFLAFVNACAQTTASLGQAYTLISTGNVFQAGLSYGSDKIITKSTGKSPTENLKEIINKSEKQLKSISKKDSIDNDLYFLVKASIEKTSKIIDLSNQ